VGLGSPPQSRGVPVPMLSPIPTAPAHHLLPEAARPAETGPDLPCSELHQGRFSWARGSVSAPRGRPSAGTGCLRAVGAPGLSVPKGPLGSALSDSVLPLLSPEGVGCRADGLDGHCWSLPNEMILFYAMFFHLRVDKAGPPS